MLIRVHAQWDEWRNADVRLADLRDVQWLQPARAPHALVHGYISCSSIVTGDIPHHCDRPSAPHQLLVCVLKRHTIPHIYAELARRAHERQTLPVDQHPQHGENAFDPRSGGLQAGAVVVRRLQSTGLLTAAERGSGPLHA
jgi:hypothetical protein